MGIALAGASDAAGWARAARLAERAEALGLHSAWLPESHFRRGALPAPLLGLAAIGARTRHLRLGTSSLLLPLHAPERIAAETAGLDRLSGGRLLLGLGRGWAARTFEGFGVAAHEKRDRFDRALDAILALWRGEARPTAEAAEAVEGAEAGEARADEEASGLRLGLRPAQRPHPPLLVAAFGRKGLLQAARRGLPYLASPVEPLAALEANRRLWREHRAPGPEPAPFAAPVMRSVFVAGSDAEARRVREALEAERPPAGARLPEAVARALEAPLAERALVGRAAEVAEGLARYRERLGMDLLVARAEPPGASDAEREAALERLAGEVLPALS